MSYVLVVDDEEPIRRLLSRKLTGWGYAVKTACDATEALEFMLADPAYIALIDIRMPGRNGLWLTEYFRDKWKDTVVVIITGADDIAVIEKSKRLGVVDYVRKPFDRELLRQAMERAAKSLEQ